RVLRREAAPRPARARGGRARGTRYHLPRRTRLRPLRHCCTASPAGVRGPVFVWLYAAAGSAGRRCDRLQIQPGGVRPYCRCGGSPMLQRVLFSGLILAGAFTVAQADVYRWVDEKGEAHYSDQWMPGAVVVKTSKAHPAAFDSSDQKSLAAASAHTSDK